MKLPSALVLLLIAPVPGLAQNVKASREKPFASDARDSPVVMEEMFVPAKDPLIQIYVRNKHLAAMNHFAAEKTVLFVHGATYPAETSFDLLLGGLSWMDYIAQRGYDVYLMDVRGYGHSTRPPQMDAAPNQNRPLADTATYVLARRSLQKLDLLGWSWGTTTMAAYAASNPDRVERLVLYAPVWLREASGPALAPALTNGPVGAYRSVTREAAFDRWIAGVPDNKKADLIPAGWFDRWWTATLATDSVGSRQNPPVLGSPSGAVEDVRRFWFSGKPTYDPAKIIVPTLLIQADWDQDTPPYMTRALFPLLVNAPEKRYVMIGEGTHHVMMERNRMQLFREVQAFLDEGSALSERVQ